jgi:hypothetical protein
LAAHPTFDPAKDIMSHGHQSLAESAAMSPGGEAVLFRAPSLLQRAMSPQSVILTGASGPVHNSAAAEDAPPGMCALGACATSNRMGSMGGTRWRVAANSTELGDLDQRFLARLRGLIHKVPSPGSSGHKLILICEDKHATMAHTIMLACDCLSVAILVTFLAELCSKLWVHPEFFKNSMLHIVDLLVVCMSLAADVFGILLYYWHIGGLDVKVIEIVLVMIRLWRVLRIFHTAFSIYYRSTAPLKHKLKLQKQILRKDKKTVSMLRTLTGLHKVGLSDLRNVEREMHEMDRAIMQPLRPGFMKDPQ